MASGSLTARVLGTDLHIPSTAADILSCSAVSGAHPMSGCLRPSHVDELRVSIRTERSFRIFADAGATRKRKANGAAALPGDGATEPCAAGDDSEREFAPWTASPSAADQGLAPWGPAESPSPHSSASEPVAAMASGAGILKAASPAPPPVYVPQRLQSRSSLPRPGTSPKPAVATADGRLASAPGGNQGAQRWPLRLRAPGSALSARLDHARGHGQLSERAG